MSIDPLDTAISSAQKVFASSDELVDPLPDEPGPIIQKWWDVAHGVGPHAAVEGEPVQPNPNAFTLSTVGADGGPSSRIVLCKTLDVAKGRLIFHTNYRGQKSKDLDGNPRVAALFHWDRLDRQIRIRGVVEKATAEESDAYFQTRPWERKIGAWSSDQSERIESREALIAQSAARLEEFGLNPEELEPWDRSVHVPRPPHWGGWRIWFESVELWCAGPGRIHDRAVWTRTAESRKTDLVVWDKPLRLQP